MMYPKSEIIDPASNKNKKEMAKSLVYVNKEIIVGLSAPYLGSEIQLVKKVRIDGGFNWLIQANISETKQEGLSVQIRDMCPEAVANQLVNAMPSDMKFDNVDVCTNQLKQWDREDNVGKLIDVSGVLKLQGVSTDESFNPFAPQAIEVSTFSYYGTECFACELTGEAIRLPVYFDIEAIQLIKYCNNKLVEIIGSLGWSPYYDAGKNRSINSILKGAALWVK